MGRQTEQTEEQTKSRRFLSSGWSRLIPISFILMSLISYMREGKPVFVPLAMKPLEVAPQLTKVRALTAAPGALRGRDVILVTLDTTRPDRLGCYGNREIRTPTLDRLAAEGVIFSNAIATAPTTLPAHASILTGLFPFHHGARSNGIFKLATGERTIAEMLGENGYQTAAFVSAFVVAKQFGLDQGFAHYDDELGSSTIVSGSAERSAEQTTERASQWLETRGSAPYFMWVHYFEPHQAERPPSPFREQNAHPYDGEIAFMDHELGVLLDKVRATSKQEPLIIVVADHGEALGEHGELSHGYLAYDATLRIPLIVHAPEVLGSGKQISALVSQVDLLPTIASLLGIELSHPLDGVDLTKTQEQDRVVIAEAVDGHMSFGWAELAAIYRGSLKYIDGPIPELFDRARDPLERNNLISQRPQIARELRQQLRSLREQGSRSEASSTTDLDQEDLARLQALGYVATAAPEPGSGARGPDPKEEMSLMAQVFYLVAKIQVGPPLPFWKEWLGRLRGERESLGNTVGALEAMEKEHPNFGPLLRYLAVLYDAQKRPEEATRARQRLKALLKGEASD